MKIEKIFTIKGNSLGYKSLTELHSHEYWMRRALKLAGHAADAGEVPVGAVVVKDNQLVGEGYNQPIVHADPTAHAEIVAVRDACRRLGNYRLPGCTLYVTIEPCTMCVGALIHARIDQLVFGALEPKAGAVCSQLKLLDQDHYNHYFEWQGDVLAEEARELISSFFYAKRKK